MTTSIFNISPGSSANAKIHVSHAELPPTYLDPTQPPTKRIPFRQINSIPFVRNLQICMPQRVHELLYNEDKTSQHDSGDASPNTTLKHHQDATSQQRHDSHSPKYTLKYSKVILTLQDILHNYVLRTGNYAMISRPPSSSPLPSHSSNDTSITFNRGTLIIDMPAHIYQHSGLASSSTTKIPSGGRKHDKSSARYRAEFNMRVPAMVKGKKGFDRLMYAAMNVEGLREPRVWLFTEAIDETFLTSRKKRKREADPDPDTIVANSASGNKAATTVLSTPTHNDTPLSPSTPAITPNTSSSNQHILAPHHPTPITHHGASSPIPSVLIPRLLSSPIFFSSLAATTTVSRSTTAKAGLPTVLEDDIYEAIEYLGLLFLQSPRITEAGYKAADPYLCRYDLPSGGEDPGSDGQDRGSEGESQSQVRSEDVLVTEWTGFMAERFVMQIVVDLLRRSRTCGRFLDGSGWVAINVQAHQTEGKGGTDGYMILLQAGNVSLPASVVGQDEGFQERSGVEGGGPGGFQYVTCFEFVDSTV